MTGPASFRYGCGLAVCLLTGCASQGPLRPPSLNLPAAVRHLEARRVGNGVDLSWTNPSKTSDGVSLTAKHGAGALTAEICQSETVAATTCTPFVRVPVTSGAASVYHDALPPALASGPIRGLSYRVRVVNAQAKGAAWTEAQTAAGATPPPLKTLLGTPVANGILLRWQPAGDGVMFRVSRGTDTAHSTLLRVSDPSVSLDTDGHAGQEQRYTAFRQQTVQMGGRSVVLQSQSITLVVPASTKLPLPDAPTNLEAVVNTLGKAEVDLVWQPPDDVSVTGYRVYRQDGDAAAVLLTPEAIKGFTYTDIGVQAGHLYSYRVCAVNPSGESPAAQAAAALP